MATYRQIADYVRDRYGWVPQSCHISSVKRMLGLPMKSHSKPYNVKPCPTDKVPHIIDAFKHFKMI